MTSQEFDKITTRELKTHQSHSENTNDIAIDKNLTQFPSINPNNKNTGKSKLTNKKKTEGPLSKFTFNKKIKYISGHKEDSNENECKISDDNLNKEFIENDCEISVNKSSEQSQKLEDLNLNKIFHLVR